MYQPPEHALQILKKRYFRDGEDWEKMCKRVAKELANTDEEYERFFKVLVEAEFLPNSPCLVNAGKPNAQYCACFVLPVGDSIEEIFDSVKHTALIHKTGGGSGFSFSKLRPEGSIVKKTKGIASGPISFMKVFDAATQQMKQGGVRRGANMGTLRVDHPDIVKFIKCKNVDGEISNFNISVAITDDFMRCLEETPNYQWVCEFDNKRYWIRKGGKDDGNWCSEGSTKPSDSPGWYTPKDIWDLIVYQTWKNGEPGVLFIDEIKRKNGIYIEACNPCGETPLEDYEACCLGSIDLSKLVNEEKKTIKYDKLRSIVETGVLFLNNMLDKSHFPIPQIARKVQENRKIGLGIMGWADMLLKIGVRYGSSRSIEVAEQIMEAISEIAHKFSKENNFCNKTVTTIAPTGTLSLLAGCSGGIEPNMDWVTEHNRKDFGSVRIVHPLVTFAEPLPDYYVTAYEVTPQEHVRMQSVFQRYTDNAVSKTINLPKDAGIREVDETLYLAWSLGCKGITMYRDGSRENQVISRQSSQKTEQNLLEIERPYVVDSKTYKVPLDLDGKVINVYTTISVVNDRPYEVFIHSDQLRDISQIVVNYIDTTTRLISLAMRSGTPIIKVIEQLEKIPGTMIYSLPVKIANILREFCKVDKQCPECQSKVIYSEGCMKCANTGCGWSKCG